MFNVPPQTEDLIKVGEGENREITINAIRNKKKNYQKNKTRRDVSNVFIFVVVFTTL